MATTRGSSATATGLANTLVVVGAGVSSSGGFALLLSFAGVLAGASLIFVGVRVVDGDPTSPTARPVWCSPLTYVHVYARSYTACAATSPCLCAFALLLVGLSLVNIGVVLTGEQEK